MSLSSGFDLEGFLRLDSSDFEEGAQQAKSEMDEVEQQAESTGETVESSFGERLTSAGESARAAGAAMTAGLTAPLAAVGFSSIQAASKAEEAQARFESVFQNTSDQVSEFADTFADEIGRSEHTIENMAANFGSMLNPMLESEERVAELSTEFTKLTQDLASFENRNPAKVQRDLQSALAGQSETVRKYGVDLSQARLKQMGLTEESSRAEEAQLRLQAIIEDTQSAQNNAAETSDSFANQQRALRADVKDLRIEIGQELLPIAKDLIDTIRPAIDTFEGLSGPMQRAVLAAGGIAAALGPVLLIAGQLAVTLPALAGAASSVAGALGTVAAVATGPIGIAALAIGALAFAFRDDLIPIGQRVVAHIRDQIVPRIRSLADEFMLTVRVVTSNLRALRNRFDTEINFILRIVRLLGRTLFRLFDTMIKNVIDIVSIGLSLIRGDFDGALQGVKDIINRSIGTYKDIFNDFLDFIRNAWDLKGELGDVVEGAFDAVLDPIENFISSIEDALSFNVDVSLPDIGSFDLPSGDDDDGATGQGVHPAYGPSLDTGGFVERSGLAMIHSGERVVPSAQVSDRGPAPIESGGAEIIIEQLNASGRDEGREAGKALKDELRSFDIGGT